MIPNDNLGGPRSPSENAPPRSALTGLRVLDFTRYQQGPMATVFLSDMGAEILKVEEPGGEPGRANGRRPDGFSAYFEAQNRGKKSITLDLRKPDALEVVKRLVPTVDVLVENFRPGTMERWGLGYEDVKPFNEKLIYASASAWGRKGPWAGRGGFDHVAQAFSGIMVEQGGGPDKPPHAMIGGFADQIGALFLAYGIACAIIARDQFGVGQHIDASLIGGMISLQQRPFLLWLHTGEQPGFQDRRSATYTHYECADGRYVAIAATQQNFWGNLCEAIEREDLQHHEKFADLWGRAEHMKELVAILEDHFKTKPAQYWLDRLEDRDIPYAPVLDYQAVAEHPKYSPQFWENGYIQEIDTPNLGRMRVPGSAIQMSETPPRIQGGGPELGNHTEETLLAVGYSWDDIVRLKDGGVI